MVSRPVEGAYDLIAHLGLKNNGRRSIARRASPRRRGEERQSRKLRELQLSAFRGKICFLGFPKKIKAHSQNTDQRNQRFEV